MTYITDTGEGKNNFRPVITTVVLLAGVYGVLICFGSVPGIEYDAFFVFTAVTLFCAVMCFGYFYRRIVFFLLLFAVLAFQIYAALYRTDSIHGQLMDIIGRISGRASGPAESAAGTGGMYESVPVTEGALLLAVFFAIWVFLLEIILRNHMILYLLTSAMLLLMPAFGIHTGIAGVALIAFFQLIFWAIQICYMKKEGSRLFEINGGSRAVAGKSVRRMILMLAVLLVLSVILSLNCSQFFFNAVYEFEGYVSRTVSQMTGRADDTVSGGTVSNANNYHTGEEHLQLEASAIPTETLYLKGFSGGLYIGGEWLQANSATLFNNIEEKYHWGDWSYMIGNIYRGMYFWLNSSMKGGNIDNVRTLHVKHSNGEYGNRFAPYYSQLGRSKDEAGGSDPDASAGDDGYAYYYYEKKDMNIDWGSFQRNYASQSDWYRRLQDAYMEQAVLEYTLVPMDLIPRLIRLVEDNPLSSRDEITDFILNTLSDMEYTLTPGLCPLNEDVVEYFMFENKRGYCVHFAAAAALMYRLYGVPARYATGYMAPPELFEPTEGGAYKASITDEFAHAWVEIFIEDYGWTPVEVTPPTHLAAMDSHASLGGGLLEGLLGSDESSEGSEGGSAGKSAVNVPADTGWAGGSSTGSLKGTAVSSENNAGAFIPAALLVLCAAAAVLCAVIAKRSAAFKRAGCRAVYRRIVKILRRHGYISGRDGTEADFPVIFAKAVKSVPEERAERARLIALEAAFGSGRVKPEEDAYMREIYRDTVSFIYKNLGWSGKIRLNLAEAFIL